MKLCLSHFQSRDINQCSSLKSDTTVSKTWFGFGQVGWGKVVGKHFLSQNVLQNEVDDKLSGVCYMHYKSNILPNRLAHWHNYSCMTHLLAILEQEKSKSHWNFEKGLNSQLLDLLICTLILSVRSLILTLRRALISKALLISFIQEREGLLR